MILRKIRTENGFEDVIDRKVKTADGAFVSVVRRAVPVPPLPSFVPVTSIIPPGSRRIAVSTWTPLMAFLLPFEATNKRVTWSVADPFDSDNISFDIIDGTPHVYIPFEGEITLRAIVVDGTAPGINYEEDFTFTVLPALIPVTGIILETPLVITHTQPIVVADVLPAGATYDEIRWSLVSRTGNTLRFSGNSSSPVITFTGGVPDISDNSLTLRATVVDWSIPPEERHTEDFTFTAAKRELVRTVLDKPPDDVEPFRLTVNAHDGKFILPIYNSNGTNVVDWGDGNLFRHTGGMSGGIPYEYDTPGIYTIKIYRANRSKKLIHFYVQ